jgi:hypothetical protein
MLKPDISELKLGMSALKPSTSKRKLDINILLLLYVAILVVLGVSGAATTAGVVLAKTAKVQTTTSPCVKIVDGLAAQSK